MYGPPKGAAQSVVLVHGAGGCRAMYRPLARALSAAGYRCVLPDLPGHGGNLTTPLTIESAVSFLLGVATNVAGDYKGARPVYLGGSLGGYIGMEMLGSHPDAFSAALILCASQTVGVGAGLAAKVGLTLMGSIIGMARSATLVSKMVGMVRAHKHLDKAMVKECSLEPGMYFQQGLAHIAVLRATDSVNKMQRFKGQVVYIDGSKDHHDMRDRLVEAGEGRAAAIVYEGGDHFFSHDTRFASCLEQDVIAFLKGP